MNDKLTEAKAGLLVAGLTEKFLERAEKLKSDFSEWPELETALNAAKFGLHTTAIRNMPGCAADALYMPCGHVRAKDIALAPDLEGANHYVFLTSNAECTVPKKENMEGHLWDLRNGKRRHVRSFKGGNMLYDMYMAGKAEGLEVPRQFVSRPVSLYTIAPLFYGLRNHISLSEIFSDDRETKTAACEQFSECAGIIAKSDLISQIGKAQKANTAVLDPKELWKQCRLYGKALPIDHACAHIDFEFISAMNEIDRNYMAGWDGKNMFITNIANNVQCPARDFEYRWSCGICIDFQRGVAKFNPLPERDMSPMPER